MTDYDKGSPLRAITDQDGRVAVPLRGELVPERGNDVESFEIFESPSGPSDQQSEDEAARYLQVPTRIWVQH